jgi:hypothetical protein
MYFGCRRKNLHAMDTGRTAQHRLLPSATVLGRVTRAQGRLAASLKVNEVTMLAALDD